MHTRKSRSCSSTPHLMAHGPGRPVKTRGRPHGHGGRRSNSSSSTPHLLTSGPGRPIKTREPYGLSGSAYLEPASRGPRPGPAHQISRGWAAALPGPSQSSDRSGPARPGPAQKNDPWQALLKRGYYTSEASDYNKKKKQSEGYERLTIPPNPTDDCDGGRAKHRPYLIHQHVFHATSLRYLRSTLCRCL